MSLAMFTASFTSAFMVFHLSLGRFLHLLGFGKESVAFTLLEVDE